MIVTVLMGVINITGHFLKRQSGYFDGSSESRTRLKGQIKK